MHVSRLLLPLPLTCILMIVDARGADIESERVWAVDGAPVTDVAAPVEVAAAADVDEGRELFLHSWSRGDPRSRAGDGLGPLFNASSCVACHSQGGAGGGGGNHLNVVIGDGRVFHRHGGGPLPTAGAVGLGLLGGLSTRGFGSAIPDVSITSGTAVILGSLDRAVVDRVVARHRGQVKYCYERELAKGTVGNGKVAIKYVIGATGKVTAAAVAETTLRNAAVEGCITNVIRRGSYPQPAGGGIVIVTYPFVFGNASQPPPPPSVVVERNTPALFGAGLIDAIPDDVIEAAAATSIAGHPEITGKLGRTPAGIGGGRVTRFGWKGDVPDLLTFVARACSIELGLEVPGSPQPGRAAPGLDIDLGDLEDLVAFVRALDKPIEQRGPVASEGAELFDVIGCTGCHLPALGDVDGIYSDLLLHDMGTELDDNANVGYYGSPPVGSSNEWRTPPLWGVRDSAPYLHDGRAATLTRAIAAHGGEASKTRQRYYDLNSQDRGALVAFLESLQAPR